MCHLHIANVQSQAWSCHHCAARQHNPSSRHTITAMSTLSLSYVGCCRRAYFNLGSAAEENLGGQPSATPLKHTERHVEPITHISSQKCSAGMLAGGGCTQSSSPHSRGRSPLPSRAGLGALPACAGACQPQCPPHSPGSPASGTLLVRTPCNLHRSHLMRSQLPSHYCQSQPSDMRGMQRSGGMQSRARCFCAASLAPARK